MSVPQTSFNRAGVIVEANDAEYGRMLEIARRMAPRSGVDPEKIVRVKDLGGANGQTMAGHIFLDPRAFRAGFDERLNRMVSALENLKRTLIHEHAHVMQAAKREAYWTAEANAKVKAYFERVAYRFEDFFYRMHNGSR